MYYIGGKIKSILPNKLEVDGKIIFNPKWHHFETAGWKVFPVELESVERRFIKWVNGDPVEMTQEEKDSVLGLSFEESKRNKILAIDAKTSEIISQGFEFDGHIFSLSLAAQSNFMGIKVAVEGGLLDEAQFPYELTTLDDNAYMLSWENRNTFFGLVLYNVAHRLAVGRALKVQAKAASNFEELEAVVDDR